MLAIPRPLRTKPGPLLADGCGCAPRLPAIPPLRATKPGFSASDPIIDPGVPSVATIRRAPCAQRDATLDLDLPALPAVSSAEFLAVFNAKMRLCEFTFQFSDDNKEKAGIERKTQALKEFYSLVRRPHLPPWVIPRLIGMVEANVVRPISVEERLLLHADSVRIVDSAWPHLYRSYEILTQIAGAFPSHECFSVAFFQKLLIPSGSPDANEQRAINHFFAALFRASPQLRRPVVEVYETAVIDHHDSRQLSPFLLATALSVIFYVVEQTVPLLPICERAFVRAVLPLFKDEQMTFYAASLERFLGFFLDDRPSLGMPVVRALLAAFPVHGVRKQKALLGLLGIALERPIKFSTELALPLSRVLILAGESQNETVAQAGLKLWARGGVDRVIADQRRAILPFIVPSISMVMDNHWSYNVRQAAKSCFTGFQRRDGRLVQECLFESGHLAPEIVQTPQMRKWVCVVKTAHTSDQMIDISRLMQQILSLFTPPIRKEVTDGGLVTAKLSRATSERLRTFVLPRLT
jgi:hypothetical protein